MKNQNGSGEERKKRKMEERRNEERRDTDEYYYIGETSRSAHERGIEHSKDLEYHRTKSHMLRHEVICHPELRPEEVHESDQQT